MWRCFRGWRIKIVSEVSTDEADLLKFRNLYMVQLECSHYMEHPKRMMSRAKVSVENECVVMVRGLRAGNGTFRYPSVEMRESFSLQACTE